MFPILAETDSPAPNNLAKGKLNELISCVIHEELNGEYYMTFACPIAAKAYPELNAGGTVRAKPPVTWTTTSDANESFDITKQTTPIDGVVTFVAQHVSRRLADAVCTLRSLPGGELYYQAFYYGNAVPHTSGTYQKADLNGLSPYGSPEGNPPEGTVTLSAPKSVLSVFVGDEESYVSVLGGDVEFHSAGSSLYVKYMARRGEDRGASIRFGVNMLDLEHERDQTGAFNAYVPFWDDGNGNITYASGYIVQPTTPRTPIIAAPLDCSNEFETQPTSAQLVSYARNLLDTQAPWTGTETIRVDFVNGVEIDPHAAEIQLGDTVHVYWGDVDIATDLRVVAYDYDVLAERYISMELGTPQAQYVAVTGETGSGSAGNNADSPFTRFIRAGTFTDTAVTFTLPAEGTYLILTSHSSTLSYVGMWLHRTSNSNYINFSTGGTGVTLSGSGLSVRAVSAGGTVTLYYMQVG